jgi:hypothetical protein
MPAIDDERLRRLRLAALRVEQLGVESFLAG